MENVISKCNALQHKYSAEGEEINANKLAAKIKAMDKMNELVKGGTILDIGGEEFYQKYSHNKIDMLNLPKDDMHYISAVEQYDGVVAMHVLEHSPFPLIVLRNIYRILKPKGILYVAVPKPTKLFETFFPDHITMMSKDMWEKLIIMSGFTILEEQENQFNPYPDWIENIFLCQKQ
jgi:SAM-dependent methyltransferase